MGSVSDPMVSCSSFGGSVASIVFGSAYHGCSVSSTVDCLSGVFIGSGEPTSISKVSFSTRCLGGSGVLLLALG